MPSTPSDFKAPSIALPCGSRMPDLRVTVTRAFMAVCSLLLVKRIGGRNGPRLGYAHRGNLARATASALHQHGARALRALAVAHDAEALGDFRVGLEQPAEVA